MFLYSISAGPYEERQYSNQNGKCRSWPNAALSRITIQEYRQQLFSVLEIRLNASAVDLFVAVIY